MATEENSGERLDMWGLGPMVASGGSDSTLSAAHTAPN